MKVKNSSHKCDINKRIPRHGHTYTNNIKMSQYDVTNIS